MIRVNDFHGNALPSVHGACFVNSKEFFNDPRGLVWKQKMDAYIERNSNSLPFNKGKFKAHIIQLAIEYYRKQENTPIERYIDQNSVPANFVLTRREAGHAASQTEGVALTIFKTLGVLFLNVITLGLVSLIWIAKNDNRLLELDADKAGGDEFQREQERRFVNAVPVINTVFGERKALDTRIENANAQKADLVQEKKDKTTVTTRRQKLRELGSQKQDIEEQIDAMLEERKAERIAQENTVEFAYDHVGLIASRYTKRDDDEIDIVPKFKETVRPGRDANNRIVMVTTPTPQGQHVNGKATMEEILDAVFKWTKQEIALKTQNNVIHGIKLGRAPNEATQLAFCKYMVYLMIDTAGINADCSNVPHLILNKPKGGGFTEVDPSFPYRIRKRDGTGYEILYKKHDAWTPKDPNKFPRGIDPLGVKWILVRMEEDDQLVDILQKKLLSPMLKNRQGIVSEDIQLADKMIEEIAMALRERYAPLFEHCFNTFQ